MKKVFLLFALALLSISTATALEPLKVAIFKTGGAANVQVVLNDYTGGTATAIYTGPSVSLTPNSSGIIIINVANNTATTDWADITAAQVNSYYVLDIKVGGTLYAQYRLDQQIINQSQGGVLDSEGNLTPPESGSGSVGTDDNRWGELFVEGNTLHVGPGGGMAGNDELAFSYDDVTNTATMRVANKVALTAVEDAVSITQQATIDGISIGQGGGDIASNIAIGSGALTTNTNGNINLAVGQDALKSNTNGGGNIAIGYRTLNNNINGYDNIAIGNAALNTNTSGQVNIAFGIAAMYNNETGRNNIALGYSSLQGNILGDKNISIGTTALYRNNGFSNIAIGFDAGSDITSGNNNVFLGLEAGKSPQQKVNAVNSVAIGANTHTTADNQVVIGDANITETQLSGTVIPRGNNTQDLGSTTRQWKDVYIGGTTSITKTAAGSALTINNTNGTNAIAVNVAAGGGRTILSYGSGTGIIPTDVSIWNATGNVTLPSSVENGQILTIVNSSAGTISVTGVTGGTASNFRSNDVRFYVYAGGWYEMP